MTQYKDPIGQADEPKQANKWLIAWLDDFAMMLLLIGIAFWVISCQPIPT